MTQSNYNQHRFGIQMQYQADSTRMTRPILHFVHANSFPAGTYRVFFEHLRKHYDVHALPMHAHNPVYPVSNECRQAGLAATRHLVGRHFVQIPGGHLFPMEHPVAAAKAVHGMIDTILSK